MSGKERYTPEQVCEALRRAHGLKNAAAGALGCSMRTIGRYIRVHPEVRETYEEVKGLFVDKAELRLMEAVDEGVWDAVQYTLLTLGKRRGYVLGDGPRRPIHDDEAMEEFEATLIKVYGADAGEEDEDNAPGEGCSEEDEDGAPEEGCSEEDEEREPR
jgi:hypothetical protein